MESLIELAFALMLIRVLVNGYAFLVAFDALSIHVSRMFEEIRQIHLLELFYLDCLIDDLLGYLALQVVDCCDVLL